ncbi:MAG: hypothetical protein IPN76_13195 [Saprospiraceae bacterium]|nr:hypothetical protein [Saprospiraceae bacterium]
MDVPYGAYVSNNTVSGYTQPSTSEGFGIVVEGINHTVANNTVSGCDVGIQRQAGPHALPGRRQPERRGGHLLRKGQLACLLRHHAEREHAGQHGQHP